MSWQLASQCDASTLSPAAHALASVPLREALTRPGAVTLRMTLRSDWSERCDPFGITEPLPGSPSVHSPVCFTGRTLKKIVYWRIAWWKLYPLHSSDSYTSYTWQYWTSYAVQWFTKNRFYQPAKRAINTKPQQRHPTLLHKLILNQH